ncbi:MAG: sterol desaturase family protein [Methylocystis sp.]|nr:sterol desaturase family protein [Methylocystis sp.]MBI3275685.1 sterol desaturase family protein [Methylocystis sp.]
MTDSPLPFWLPLSVLAWTIHMIVFHGVGLTFEYLDRAKRLQRFRIRVDVPSYRDLLPRVLANQTLILLPAMMALEWSGLAFTGAPHLSAGRFVANLVLMAIGHDVIQYVFHRWVLHGPPDAYIGHALHHSTKAGRAISACYQTPADFFIEIVVPYLVPLALVGGGGGDIFFHLFVPSIGAIGGLYEHSGFDFVAPLREPKNGKPRGRLAAFFAATLSSKAHGEHHRRWDVSFSDGFGSPGICDTLLRTRWDLIGTKREA